MLFFSGKIILFFIPSIVGASSLTARVDMLKKTDTQASLNPNGLCMFRSPASFTVNDNLDITGGSFHIDSLVPNAGKVAVSGSITIGNASRAHISGCAKGNIALSGGGIDDDSFLFSESDLQIDRMESPKNVALWARNIVIGNGVSGGYYASLRAGAYEADVFADGKLLGTAEVGGSMLVTQANTLARPQLVLIPSSGMVELSLAHGPRLALDLNASQIDKDSGAVSVLQHQWIATESFSTLSSEQQKTLPHTLFFKPKRIVGGNISVSQVNTRILWGNMVDILGWNGKYDALVVNQDLRIGSGMIKLLLVGGDIYALYAGQTWNYPQVEKGVIHGKLYYGASTHPTLAPDSAIATLVTDPKDLALGLPGKVYCDTTVPPVQVGPLLPHANYIFYHRDGRPYLWIQNVRTADGSKLDREYDLSKVHVRRLHDMPFATCNWESTDTDSADCFKMQDTSGSWVFHGITHFPKGIVVFDGPVRIDGTQIRDAHGNHDLINTIVSTDDVILTQSGHDALRAPNRVGPSDICDDVIYPDNICAATGKQSAFVQWKDVNKIVRQGDFIADNVIAAEKDVHIGGWSLTGNVLVGQSLHTFANQSYIEGNVVAHANASIDHASYPSLIDQGGLVIHSQRGGDGLYGYPGKCPKPAPESPPDAY